MAPSFIFSYGEFTLEYTVYGHGKKHLLYFHGYGKSAQEFTDYKMDLADAYTVYSFNFFHHGRSAYPASRIDRHTLTAKELTVIITAFLQEKNIERFSLMGYSMGGKICLSLFEGLFDRVDRLILVAPDGIKTNFWYKFTSNNRLGNALYRKIIERPGPFFFFMKVLRRTRLLNKRLHEFTYQHLETREKRMQVYKVWMTLRSINPNTKQIARTIRKKQIRTSLHYGRYDRVVTLGPGKKFHARIGSAAKLHVADKGHKMANDQTGRAIEAFLKEH